MNKIARLLILILKTTLTKFVKYSLALIVTIKKDRVSGSKYKSIRKSENKMVEILANLKSWNLPKLKFGNLFKSKKTQNASTIEECKFLTSSTLMFFIKLR